MKKDNVQASIEVAFARALKRADDGLAAKRLAKALGLPCR